MTLMFMFSKCTTPPLTLLNTKTNTGKPDFFLKNKTLMLTHNPQRIFFYNNRFPTFSWRHLISCLAPSTSKSHQHWAPLSSQKWQLNLRGISTIWMTPKKNQTVMSISFSCSRKKGSEIVFKWLDGPFKIANISKSTPTALPAALPQYYQNRKVMLALGKHNQDPHLQSKPGVFWNKHNGVVVLFKPGHINGFPWPGKSVSFCWRENKTFILWLLPFIYSLVLY